MPDTPIPFDWEAVTRTLSTAHRSLIKGHFLRLDRMGRLGRFWLDVPVVHLADYAAGLDLEDGIFLGCFPDQTLRGLAEVRPMGNSQAWEAVVSVEAGWQARGLGSWLLRRAIDDARKQGALRVYMKSDVTNAAAKKIALRLGATLSEADGDTVAKLDLHGPRSFDATFDSWRAGGPKNRAMFRSDDSTKH